MGRYQNGNGYSYQEDLPERGPGAENFFSQESEQVARGCNLENVSSFLITKLLTKLHKNCLRDDVSKTLINNFHFIELCFPCF